MDISHNLDGRAELDERGLREEDLARGKTDGSDLCVLEGDCLCDLAGVACLEQAGDHRVDVERLWRRGVGGRAGESGREDGGQGESEVLAEGGGREGGRRGERVWVGEDGLSGRDLYR
jgi:hypothetical protein